MIVGDELLRKRTEDRENENRIKKPKKRKSLQEMIRVKKL